MSNIHYFSLPPEDTAANKAITNTTVTIPVHIPPINLIFPVKYRVCVLLKAASL